MVVRGTVESSLSRRCSFSPEEIVVCKTFLKCMHLVPKAIVLASVINILPTERRCLLLISFPQMQHIDDMVTKAAFSTVVHGLVEGSVSHEHSCRNLNEMHTIATSLWLIVLLFLLNISFRSVANTFLAGLAYTYNHESSMFNGRSWSSGKACKSFRLEC